MGLGSRDLGWSEMEKNRLFWLTRHFPGIATGYRTRPFILIATATPHSALLRIAESFRTTEGEGTIHRCPVSERDARAGDPWRAHLPRGARFVRRSDCAQLISPWARRASARPRKPTRESGHNSFNWRSRTGQILGFGVNAIMAVATLPDLCSRPRCARPRPTARPR